MRVFVADDSAVVRERLTDMLSAIPEVAVIGYVKDTMGAISSMRTLHPDVVILDIRMPGGTGIDVLQDIKK
jgi:DNA-binding NarL/FixJ family response regulator